MNLSNRISNGARYFKNMKPSEFILGNGVINPKEWHNLQSLMDLILKLDEDDVETPESSVTELAEKEFQGDWVESESKQFPYIDNPNGCGILGT